MHTTPRKDNHHHQVHAPQLIPFARFNLARYTTESPTLIDAVLLRCVHAAALVTHHRHIANLAQRITIVRTELALLMRRLPTP